MTAAMREAAALLPCPFCGGEAMITHIEAHDHTDALKRLIPDIEPAEDTYWPECPSCGAVCSGYNSEREAIAAWNHRALPAPQADEERAARIAEVMAEYNGCWRPCSGCQESVDGCVSTRDYPYSDPDAGGDL